MPGLKSVKWEKVEGNKSKKLKKIIWKSYKDDEVYFENKNNNKKGSITKSIKSTNDLTPFPVYEESSWNRGRWISNQIEWLKDSTGELDVDTILKCIQRWARMPGDVFSSEPKRASTAFTPF